MGTDAEKGCRVLVQPFLRTTRMGTLQSLLGNQKLASGSGDRLEGCLYFRFDIYAWSLRIAVN